MIKLFFFPALLLLAACSSSQGQPVAVTTSAYSVTAVGRIDSVDEARQLVAAADGVISRVLVRRGDPVRAGQVLLEVSCDPRAAQALAASAGAQQSRAEAALVDLGPRAEERAAAAARVRQAEAQLDDAQQELDRADALVDRGFVSRRELEARTARRDGARAGLDEARAGAAELANGSRPQERASAAAAARMQQGQALAASAALAQCQVRSPIDGHVLQVLRREGEFSGASQGTPLLVVGDMSHRIVRSEVGERDAANVRIGQRIEMWIDGSPKRWRGHVAEMADVMGRRSARSLDPTDRFDRDVREVIVVIDDPDPPAVAGLRGTVGYLK